MQDTPIGATALSYSPGGGMGHPIPESEVVRPDYEGEYVASGPTGFTLQVPLALPTTIDDATRDRGEWTYDEMMTDPIVAASVQTLKLSILAGGMDLLPPVAPKPWVKERTDDEETADEIVKFCWRAIERCRGWNEAIKGLLDAVAFGNKLAEKVFRLVESGEDEGRWTWDRIRVKPRDAWQFVVDDNLNILGILFRDRRGIRSILERDKVVVLTWDGRDGDPRGTSVLRAVVDPCNLKRLTWPQLYKHLCQFGSASLVGKTAPGDLDRLPVGKDGRPIPGVEKVSPQQFMARQLVNFQNGSVLVVPSGAEVQPIQPQGDGQVFHAAVDAYNREIVHGILLQNRATMEAQYGSKADSQTGQDVMGLVVAYGRELLAGVIRHDLLRQLVALNYGDEVADRFTPLVTFGGTEQQDQSAKWSSASSLKSSGYLGDSQLPELDAMLGLPIRDAQADQQSGPDGPPVDDSGGFGPDGLPVDDGSGAQDDGNEAPGGNGVGPDGESDPEAAEFAGAARGVKGGGSKGKGKKGRKGMTPKGVCGPGGGAPCHVDQSTKAAPIKGGKGGAVKDLDRAIASRNRASERIVKAADRYEKSRAKTDRMIERSGLSESAKAKLRAEAERVRTGTIVPVSRAPGEGLIAAPKKLESKLAAKERAHDRAKSAVDKARKAASDARGKATEARKAVATAKKEVTAAKRAEKKAADPKKAAKDRLKAEKSLERATAKADKAKTAVEKTRKAAADARAKVADAGKAVREAKAEVKAADKKLAGKKAAGKAKPDPRPKPVKSGDDGGEVPNPDIITKLVKPGEPIQDRLAAYTYGDEKVKQLSSLVDDKLTKQVDKVNAEFTSLGMKMNAAVPGSPEHKQLMARYSEVATKAVELRRKRNLQLIEARDKALELLKVPNPVALKVADYTGKKEITFAANEGADFVSRVTARGVKSDPLIVPIHEAVDGRAYWAEKGVHLATNGAPGTAVHEIGHHMDNEILGVAKSSRDFLAYRVGNEPLRKMKDLFPSSGYRDDEMVRKDKFDRAFGEDGAWYVGKDYPGKHSEITSMGVEKLYEDPVSFAKKDPEYAKFIIGILHGHLR
jgi:hypothetical protein